MNLGCNFWLPIQFSIPFLENSNLADQIGKRIVWRPLAVAEVFCEEYLRWELLWGRQRAGARWDFVPRQGARASCCSTSWTWWWTSWSSRLWGWWCGARGSCCSTWWTWWWSQVWRWWCAEAEMILNFFFDADFYLSKVNSATSSLPAQPHIVTFEFEVIQIWRR